MTTNPLIAQFAGVEALVDPSKRARFEACLEQAAAHPLLAEAMKATESASSEETFWPSSDDTGWRAQLRPYVVKDGILQIPVKGVLLHNFPYALFDWATGYEYIWQAFKRGCADYAIGQIKGIALICDTPGGMVAGCFDARDKMVALKEETGVPVRGFAHESAYSAGYATISIADHIVVSRTGGVGSIGVVTGHLSVAGAMEKAGLVFTYIFAGEGKVDGNPYEDLKPEAKARIQARIDELYGIFVSAVARSRGLEEAFIRETLGAHCYTATQATSNGLADSIGSLDDAVSAFAGFLDDQSDKHGEEDMADEATSAVDQAALDQAHAAGVTQGNTEGAKAERARISAILASDAGKARPIAAMAAAMDTDMSVDAATAFLAKLPEEKPAAAAPDAEKPAATTLAGAMAETGNPDIGASGKKDDDKANNDNADDVLALAAGLGLKGFAKPAAK